MWPFKKDTEKAKSPKQTLLEEMQSWRKVGETFAYLGRECVVTGYTDYFATAYGGVGVNVLLSADYADDLGVIRRITFEPHEWRALAARQANNEVRGCPPNKQEQER